MMLAQTTVTTQYPEWTVSFSCTPPATATSAIKCGVDITPKTAAPVVTPIVKAPVDGLNPTDPVKPTRPVTPVVPVSSSYAATAVRDDLNPIAYNMRKRSDNGVMPTLKAGESTVNEFGVTVTRVTDRNTGPGNVFAQFYSNRAPACGNFLLYWGLGGSTHVMNMRTTESQPLSYQSPDFLILNSYQWTPNCSAIYFSGGNFRNENFFEVWKYTLATKTFAKIKDYSADILKVFPGMKGHYMPMQWMSFDETRFLFGVERTSKDTPGVMLVDGNGVRVFSLNPVPSRYSPALPLNFTSAGITGATRDGKFWMVQYNGSAPGINTMTYVIPWNENPNTYAAFSVAGLKPTYHGTMLDDGFLGIQANGKVGKTWDPALNREDCSIALPVCSGSPNWWYSLLRFDFTGTPNASTGYPVTDTTAYPLVAGGYHLMASPDGKVIASSTYQESPGRIAFPDGTTNLSYLTPTALHNELFLTFLEPQTWATDEGPYVVPANTVKTVRLAALNTRIWNSDGYWAQPHCAWNVQGNALYCSIGDNGFVDIYEFSGFTK
jgi:hypothetical protein